MAVAIHPIGMKWNQARRILLNELFGKKEINHHINLTVGAGGQQSPIWNEAAPFSYNDLKTLLAIDLWAGEIWSGSRSGDDMIPWSLKESVAIKSDQTNGLSLVSNAKVDEVIIGKQERFLTGRYWIVYAPKLVKNIFKPMNPEG